MFNLMTATNLKEKSSGHQKTEGCVKFKKKKSQVEYLTTN